MFIRNQVGQFIKGSVPLFTDSHREKIRISKIGNRNGMFGKKESEDHKSLRTSKIRGENHWNWKGGITSVMTKIKLSDQYSDWRNAVLKRDNYMCIWCDSKKNLEVDHIVELSKIFQLGKILVGAENVFDWIMKNRFFLGVWNGRTLCKECHYLRTHGRQFATQNFLTI